MLNFCDNFKTLERKRKEELTLLSEGLHLLPLQPQLHCEIGIMPFFTSEENKIQRS